MPRAGFSAKYVINLTLLNMRKAVDRSVSKTTKRIGEVGLDNAEVLDALHKLTQMRDSINSLLNAKERN